ncbi:MAG: uroporphyrinogen-III C-methyltransferase [Planctomycetota bacterium]
MPRTGGRVRPGPARVHLVGAGPGDPGLLTLRGAEVLRRAEVVLYDGLSNPAILTHAGAAECVCVGKHGQTRIWTQAEINAELLSRARAGARVVRLKGGDPAVFARTSEEVDALRNADIAFEIVPGITAALAAGSYAGIPVTHRGIASAVALVTGHEKPGKPASDLDWNALARFPGTLVVYMGVTTARQWTQALLDNGKPPETPCAILRRCSMPDQMRVHCRLDEVADQLTPASKIRPPVITIVGPVTQLADAMSWLDRRPLFGMRVLVTRPKSQCESLAESLRERGADVVEAPAIEIGAADEFHLERLDAAITELPQTDWVVFGSVNAVDHFIHRLRQRNLDARAFGGTRIAAIGKRTADRMSDSFLSVDLVPKAYAAETLADEMVPLVKGKRVLVVRADRGESSWVDRLSAAGADVKSVAAYRNIDVTEPPEGIANQIVTGDFDWVTATSSASVRNIIRWLDGRRPQTRLAVISPVTAAAAEAAGWKPDAVGRPHTTDGLVEAMVSATHIPDSAL